MKSRIDLYQHRLQIEGDIQLLEKSGNRSKVESLLDQLENISRDLKHLKSVPESLDAIEEFYLRFLGRCRLTVIGPYAISAVIGAGWNGVVFRGRAQDKSTDVAIKLLLLPRNSEELYRFEQEAEILLRLNHPAIVRGLSPSQYVEGLPIRWFAMELVETPQSLLAVARRESIATLARILTPVCEGLAHAHRQNVVHRDLHFGNILVNNLKQPKILDFGSAKFHEHGHTFQPIGSFRTSAPEKFFEPNFVTGKSDVFSIAMMFYIAAMGISPLDSTSFGDLIKKIEKCSFAKFDKGSKALCDGINSALAKDANDRPDATALAQIFSAAATDDKNNLILATNI